MNGSNGLASGSPLVEIAPAPVRNGASDSQPSPQLMPYTCQTCTKRKVRCDKVIPTCSTCRKAKLECEYIAPAPRRKKRKLSDDVNDKLKRYETILQANGLLKDAVQQEPEEESPAKPQALQHLLRLNHPETARIGKLLSSSGKSRYIDSNLWHTIGDDDMDQLSDEDEDPAPAPTSQQYISDPLSAAFVGTQAPLAHLHPSYDLARQLWSKYITNVDPLCRVIHAPSTEAIVDQAARDPSSITKQTECLVFAIYHFAVVSLSDTECLELMQESRTAVMAKYRHATCQALVNASFLRTSEMPILQAYILFLLSVRNHYDPHTFWILSGVAWRIGQRMGLHRDGEILGLPPFEVHMRRRLFWQLLPMDGIAAQISGTGISPAPDSWDTEQPWNVDEKQVWPGMTEKPEEQEVATDMIFCLARTEIGRFHQKTTIEMRDKSRAVDAAAEAKALEERISRTEDMLERRFVRYCDVIEPLHFLTISLCRGAMVVLRLRVKVAQSKQQTPTRESMREIHRLAMKVVNYDITVSETPGLHRYMWHFKALFLHSAMACALTSLQSPFYLSQDELREAWQRIGQIIANHEEIVSQRRALHIAIGRLAIKAWDASAASAGLTEEPEFIKAFRQMKHRDSEKRVSKLDRASSSAVDSAVAGISPENGAPFSVDDFNFESEDYSLNSVDWMYWDQMMQDFQGQAFNASS